MGKNEHTCQRTHVQNYGYTIKVDVRTTLYCDCFFRQKMYLGHVCCYLNCQCLNIFDVNKKRAIFWFIYLHIYLFVPENGIYKFIALVHGLIQAWQK